MDWLLPDFSGPATFLAVLPCNDHLMALEEGVKLLNPSAVQLPVQSHGRAVIKMCPSSQA